ncbi:MAG: antitoxin VapB family protein [Candidatus Njordarchaeales archaeon]
MARYVTISVPVEVKKRLEKLKGKEDWGSFLLRICMEYERMLREKAFREILEILDENDLETIESSAREFRKKFRIGDTSETL